MKATGIVRRIDDLGRVVIPKEIRRQMRIKEGDPLEVYTYNGAVCFRRYSPIGEMDLAIIKAVCDGGLGILNYVVYDIDGNPIVPNGKDIHNLNLDTELNDENLCPINTNGECVGYLKTPSGNRQVVADILGNIISD